MRRHHRHKRDTPDWYINHAIDEMVKHGVFECQYRDGHKVYRLTEAGRYAYDKLRSQFTEDEIENELPDSLIRRRNREAISEYNDRQSHRQAISHDEHRKGDTRT
jgi:DNA-binding PadR family transcriptional regulator